ncbi:MULTISPECIES: LysR family transcriptional regulator [Pseudomonas syringae group]|uniref:LysR family transcriptional regulator n=4 Tax=Pseudomonas coronafaciens TaxID=53409 RepID=A0AAE6ULV0_9PSED|nr:MULTISPECIES: LysR family transcriptional regulator [Pseudomonas syringae group]KOP52221.1 LysR family transcriptional regulator [Pseudomonas coronafaciens pv. porri]KOP56910.1 LysR family transcriptional regulator [Pseudomonas coronafaciens pv. porri]KPX30159.1 Regulatory protein, LysR substrate-binding protein [Pseudomonas coronafaciens pv. garcae]MCF5804922.1 LysR family transcriptional regulator [Pseudomonas tremae]MCF5811095.1 LysR family transcriptional regulator [Pseudomonas tremae]
MDLFQAMRVYVKVVEAGSLTAAAQACSISTTMVGNHLRALEQRLGVSLLQRTTRRQRLTEFGTAYYERCLEVLGLVAESEQLAEQAQGDPSGTLRITAPLTFGSEVLAPALAEFSRHFPQVRLDLVLTNQRLDMIDNGFDVAVRLGNIPEASPLIARPMQDYTLTICAAPAYLARHGAPTHPEDLRAHNCLPFAYPAGDEWRTAGTQWRMTGPEGEVLVEVDGSLIANTSAGLYQAARAGMGIVMLPDALVQRDLQEGQLVALLPDYHLPRRPMNLLYVQDRYRLPKLRSFVEFALQRWGR